MKQVQMPAAKRDALLKVIKWYDAMPAFLEVGDRFHERMGEEIDNLLPTIPEIESDNYFSLGVVEQEGELILTIQSVTDYLDEIEIQLVPTKE